MSLHKDRGGSPRFSEKRGVRVLAMAIISIKKNWENRINFNLFNKLNKRQDIFEERRTIFKCKKKLNLNTL